MRPINENYLSLMALESTKEELRRRWLAGEQISVIAYDMQCSSPTIRNTAARMGLPMRSKNYHGTINCDLLRTMWLGGKPTADIGAAIGRSVASTRRIAASIGLPPRSLPPAVKTKRHQKPQTDVRKPAPELCERADYLEIIAAITRAKNSRTPLAALGIIKSRFRLKTADMARLGA